MNVRTDLGSCSQAPSIRLDWLQGESSIHFQECRELFVCESDRSPAPGDDNRGARRPTCIFIARPN
jgi:hypothetical protein